MAQRDAKVVKKGWNEWVSQPAVAQARQKVAASKASKHGDVPVYQARRDTQYMLTADPGAAQRDNTIPEPEYEPLHVRFIRQNNGEVFFKFYSTWVVTRTGKQFVISNARNGERNVPCLLYFKLCTADTNDGSKGARSMYSAQETYAAEVDILEEFHQTEVAGKTKTYIKNQRCGGTDLEGNVTCPHCLDGHTENKIFGLRAHIRLFPAQKRTLESSLEEFEHKCLNCHQGTVSVLGYECSGCGQVFGDHKLAAEDPGFAMSEAEEALYSSEAVQCPTCSHEGMAKPRLECIKTIGFGAKRRAIAGCDEPKMEDPLNCVLTLTSEKIGRTNSLKATEALLYDEAEWPERTGPTDSPYTLAQMYDHVSLKEQMISLGLTPEEIPFNLEEAQRELKEALAKESSGSDTSDSVPW